MIRIRPARLPEDIAAIGEIHYLSRMQTYAGIFPAAYLAKQSVQGWCKTWHDIVQAPAFAAQQVFVAVDAQDRVHGFAHTGPINLLETETIGKFSGELYALHVRKAFQAQGVGLRLLNAARQWQRMQGRSSMRLWVLTENTAAIAFYEHQGARRARANWFVVDDDMIEELEYGWTTLAV